MHRDAHRLPLESHLLTRTCDERPLSIVVDPAFLVLAGNCVSHNCANGFRLSGPAKLAQDYPLLAGEVVKIGSDAQTPPCVVRDSAEFKVKPGISADMAASTIRRTSGPNGFCEPSLTATKRRHKHDGTAVP
jgi:hypothetical protein